MEEVRLRQTLKRRSFHPGVCGSSGLNESVIVICGLGRCASRVGTRTPISTVTALPTAGPSACSTTLSVCGKSVCGVGDRGGEGGGEGIGHAWDAPDCAPPDRPACSAPSPSPCRRS
eukprot:scaffold65929_cov34-Tisochrysis_lutea.AAC.3